MKDSVKLVVIIIFSMITKINLYQDTEKHRMELRFVDTEEARNSCVVFASQPWLDNKTDNFCSAVDSVGVSYWPGNVQDRHNKPSKYYLERASYKDMFDDRITTTPQSFVIESKKNPSSKKSTDFVSQSLVTGEKIANEYDFLDDRTNFTSTPRMAVEEMRTTPMPTVIRKSKVTEETKAIEYDFFDHRTNVTSTPRMAVEEMRTTPMPTVIRKSKVTEENKAVKYDFFDHRTNVTSTPRMAVEEMRTTPMPTVIRKSKLPGQITSNDSKRIKQQSSVVKRNYPSTEEPDIDEALTSTTTPTPSTPYRIPNGFLSGGDITPTPPTPPPRK